MKEAAETFDSRDTESARTRVRWLDCADEDRRLAARGSKRHESAPLLPPEVSIASTRLPTTTRDVRRPVCIGSADTDLAEIGVDLGVAGSGGGAAAAGGIIAGDSGAGMIGVSGGGGDGVLAGDGAVGNGLLGSSLAVTSAEACNDSAWLIAFSAANFHCNAFVSASANLVSRTSRSPSRCVIAALASASLASRVVRSATCWCSANNGAAVGKQQQQQSRRMVFMREFLRPTRHSDSYPFRSSIPPEKMLRALAAAPMGAEPPCLGRTTRSRFVVSLAVTPKLPDLSRIRGRRHAARTTQGEPRLNTAVCCARGGPAGGYDRSALREAEPAGTTYRDSTSQDSRKVGPAEDERSELRKGARHSCGVTHSRAGANDRPGRLRPRACWGRLEPSRRGRACLGLGDITQGWGRQIDLC